MAIKFIKRVGYKKLRSQYRKLTLTKTLPLAVATPIIKTMQNCRKC
jgi:hypothetical protein